MHNKTRIVFLDAATVDCGDVNTTRIARLGDYQAFANSSRDEIIQRAKNAEIIITNKCVMADVIQSLPNLKLVCAAATGTNHIDVNVAKNRGVAVCNVRDYSTITVAEHALLFLLALSHRLHEHNQSAWEGGWATSPFFADLRFPFSDLHGKTLGIVGYGKIGRRVARLARGFGMKVLVAKIPGRKYPAKEKRISLVALCKKADFISLHTALADNTREIVNEELLRHVLPHACIINLARGGLVNEHDLAAALNNNQLAGYASDVLVHEPPRQGSLLMDTSLRQKVMITPHIAWASRESRQKLLDEIAANIEAFLKGKKRNRVDK